MLNRVNKKLKKKNELPIQYFLFDFFSNLTA
jgi:hypothetical protein